MNWLVCLVEDNICDFCSFCYNQISFVCEYVGIYRAINIYSCHECRKLLWNCECNIRLLKNISPSEVIFTIEQLPQTVNQVINDHKNDSVSDHKNDSVSDHKNVSINEHGNVSSNDNKNDPDSVSVNDNKNVSVNDNKNDLDSVLVNDNKNVSVNDHKNDLVINNKFTKEKCSLIINNLNMIININPNEKFWISGNKIMLNNSYWITRRAYGQNRIYIIDFIMNDIKDAIELLNSLGKLDFVDNELINIKELIKKTDLGLENMKITYPELNTKITEIIEIIKKI